MELLLATRNAHKTREVQQLLGVDFRIVDLSSRPEMIIAAETGQTFEQNAILKARSISESVENFVIADDSGLEVDALGGAPGIYSARYAGENANDARNTEKLLSELRDRKIPVEKWNARFRCAIALAKKGKVAGTFSGTVEGMIVDPPRGKNGFGYDPVFLPSGFEQTFAEMTADLKNKISHRAKAIAALRQTLRALKEN